MIAAGSSAKAMDFSSWLRDPGETVAENQDGADPPDDPNGSKPRDLKPPSDIEIERWYKTYRSLPEPRGISTLRKVTGASIHRVRRAVLFGWPEVGYVAFKDRILASEPGARAAVRKVALEVESQAIARVAQVVVGTWEESARKKLAGLRSVDDALEALASRILEAARGASFVSYRRVPDLDAAGQIRRDEAGNAIMVQRAFVSGHAVSIALARHAVAAKDAAILSRLLLDAVAPAGVGGLPMPGEGGDADAEERARDPRLMTTVERRARVAQLVAKAREPGVEPPPEAGEPKTAGKKE